MSKFDLVRFGSVSAFLTIASFIAGAVLLGVSGGKDLIPIVDEADDWLVNVSDYRSSFEAGGWFFVLAPVLAIGAGLGIHRALRPAGDLALLAVAAWLVGSTLVTISHIIPLAMAYELAPAYAAGSNASQSGIEVLARTLAMTSQLLNVVGNALDWGVGVGGFAVAILRTSVFPKWTGWLGLVPAVIGGWLGLLSPFSDAIQGISFLGILALFVWMIAVAVFLWRLREPAAGSVAAAATL